MLGDKGAHEDENKDTYAALDKANAALHQNSIPINATSVIGYQFGSADDIERVAVAKFCKSFKSSGFQATQLGRAIDIVNEMRAWRLADDAILEDDIGTKYADMEIRKSIKCFTWLSFTSNMISSGLRESFVYLAKNKMIDCIVTSAGGIEEDIIKCLGETVLGEFVMDPKMMRNNGWNRIGNLIVPNENYVLFENWFQPLLEELSSDTNTNWTPSKVIAAMGKRINNEQSLLYWCWKHDIPVFCPAITDGAIGDQLFFFSYKKDFRIDVVEDIRRICNLAMDAKKSGAIILGGGVSKHHVCNSNLFRNGLDFAVYINTAQEYDGCDSGGNVEEAVTWGKISMNAKACKVVCDATIAFPLLMGATYGDK